MSCTREYLRDFYSVCEKCGRSGHEPVEPEGREPQCVACIETRRRVGRHEAAYIIEAALRSLA